MDLPKQGEANAILVIVDRLNKRTRFTAMEMFLKESKEELETTPHLMMDLFFDLCILSYGMLISIVNNKDIYFMM